MTVFKVNIGEKLRYKDQINEEFDFTVGLIDVQRKNTRLEVDLNKIKQFPLSQI